MPIKTKRWCDPVEADDGYRLLVTRFRPRGVKKANETWDGWCPDLGPTAELHAQVYGKHGAPITWEEYRERYLQEMKLQADLIGELAKLVAEGKSITLLCSSACTDEARCHRSLLKELIEAKQSRD